jgi:predicted nuclease with TOPRIM domain
VTTNEAVGYRQTGIAKPKSEAEIRCEALSESLMKTEEENKALKQRLSELEAKLESFEVRGQNSPRRGLTEAKLLDGVVNQS